MSADSPRRSLHKGAQIVSPQPIVDRSIIDSVAGIINDIVPQAYAGVPNVDNKESIAWARFEYADINDPTLYPDYNEGSSTPPLLLVLGYTTGVQVWLIAATGEASEVLSWRQGVVRTLRILPNPKTDEEHSDPFEPKRPMVAICDSAGPGPQYLCNISFISLKTGEQTKTIKFKNPVCDILANRRSVVVAFLEKIAVFDARTLEDILTVTSCYASPGPNPNPIALGTRWLAYSEKKLLPTRRSSGGCEGEGVQSYTATVLYAAKSLGKGLRGLGETVASSLTGNSVSPVAINNTGNDVTQPGIVSILDLQAAKDEKELDNTNMDTLIAHFTAHTDAIVAMTFDLTGALLMTADRRGHDFHVFRIQPHPGGPTLAAVHHLYVLHRGDTTAKVQDMTFSSDTRWAAISTVRGTTHVFPVAPYGGPIGVRTHSTPQVVNRLSRFHRSAGLTDDGTRSHSPVSHSELPISVYPYSNPRLPPYPHPTILHPLAQIPQPSSLNHVTSQSQTSRPQQQRQRLHSDDSGGLPLKICACFAPPRAWIYAQRESGSKVAKRAVDSLFIMACHGNMIQYDLEPKPATGVAKEKICDDTTIELEVEARGQWPLLRSPNSVEIMPPLPLSSPLLTVTSIPTSVEQLDTAEDRWLSQVEIVTHAGPHRRLWMGPQFVFKTYNAPSGVAVNLVEAEAVEIGVSGGSRPARSNPVNMPHAASRPLVPVVIDGSGSSYEQSPRFMEAYGDPLDGENMRIGSGENQLREDLAEAMLETSIAPNRAPGRRSVFERVGQPVTKVVNPLGTVITVSADEEDVSSSQEFDSAEEGLVPEPPRSVCAEEGPASLGDLEPESQTLRDLTEICAEMRAANEPAIDSVPDESIREIKERRALCAEIAVATKSSSIDFEREEAFQDVPTSLSLCAEEGEVPSSPMTQAKETAWCRRSGRHDDVVTHERNFAKAKYVVNYDEDCVVLMENRALTDRRRAVRLSDEPVGGRAIGEQTCEQADNVATHHEKPTKKACKSLDGTGESTSKPRVGNESKTRVEKYVVRENEDSIVIEDVTRPKESKAGRSRKKATGASNVELTDDNVQTKYAKKSKLLKEVENDKCTGKSIDAFVDLDALEVTSCADASTQLLEDQSCNDQEGLAEGTLLEQSPRSEADPNRLDDLRAMEYNMVEEDCSTKDSGSQNQSDEEIEHVQRSDVAQTRGSESGSTKVKSSLGEFSPIVQRKNSKSTISDDDLEYINSSELAETLERVAATKLASSDKPEENSSVRRHSKHALSSDDDLEHIHHSDICELSGDTSVTTDLPDRSSTSSKKSQSLGTTEQTTKSRTTKKQQHSKDIVVIESDASEAEVTLVVKSMEGWVRSKTPEKDPVEEMIKGLDTKAHALDQGSSSPPSASKSKPARSTKASSTVSTLSKRSQSGTVEIIDIDAMQKAEMEIGTEGSAMPSAPECKILSPRHEARSSRRSRRNKKSQVEPGAQDLGSVDPAQASKPQTDAQLPEDSSNESVGQEKIEISWSSIVKKSPSTPSTGGAPIEAENPRRECDLEPLIEVEERAESQEAKVRLAEARVMERAEEACCEPPSDSLERAVDPRERKALRRNGEESTRIVEGTFERRKLTTKGSESVVERTEDTQRTELQARMHDGGGKGSRPPLVPVSKSSQAAASTAKARPSDEAKASQEDFPIAPPPSSSSSPPPPGSSSSKENSPEPEAEAPKRRDSKQETVPDRSSSSDELNANVLPMDTEEDCCLAREIVERSVNNPSASLIIGTTKKGGRYKRKKHR